MLCLGWKRVKGEEEGEEERGHSWMGLNLTRQKFTGHSTWP
jgi:hypothetical protein